ncbi:MAG: hypothetical protein AAFO96_10070, partial [Bacteroidota bacterium]
MKTYIVSLILCLWGLNLSAQLVVQRQVFSPTGNQVDSGGIRLFQTFGEPVIGLSTGSLNVEGIPGFQQPIPVPVSNISIVWPGDANSDLVADNVDLLAIGLYYGSTGPTRTNASNNWYWLHWAESLTRNLQVAPTNC